MTTDKINDEQKKTTSWLWPSVRTLQSAHKATRRAFWFSVVIAVFTGWFSFLAACGNQWLLGAGVEPWSLIDAALAAGIAVGLYRHSRFAAVAGLVLGVASILGVMLSPSNYYPAKLGMPIIFTLALVGAVRGTFAYHRMRQADDQKNMA
jgi:hypothetical protein